MRKYGLLRGEGKVGRHKAEVGAFEIGTSKGVKGGTNVKEGIDG